MNTPSILAISVLISAGHAYFRGPIPSNYLGASSYCQSQGSTLASIGSVTDWNDAKSVCGSAHCWIGVRDIIEGRWAWDDGIDIGTSYGFNSDGTATTGQGPWNAGEPNNSGGSEDCVMMYSSASHIGGKYNDAWCFSVYYPLCNGRYPYPNMYRI